MYHINCDGYILFDPRDEDLIVESPKVNLEVNTVCEGSFTIYKNHPYYDKLKALKSVFEVSDDIGVIFRGRMTNNSCDFHNSKFVDLEGAMAYFNDSRVRPYVFPEDWLDDADYITAAESGNVIEFFLNWLINQHNAQVEEFQRFKLGTVTVTDPNNYLSRSDSKYPSTWEVLESKLFKSDLGGNLCIRYEKDGNYIDYLSEFELTNTQDIVFGENLLDLKSDADATETYSAVIPIGATIETETTDEAGNTVTNKTIVKIENLPDGDITGDIVKKGDMIYSKMAVESYGLIIAPVDETTWEDVTSANNLLTKARTFLASEGMLVTETVEMSAADLHFTDDQIRSFRIYRNVKVQSIPHGLSGTFPLPKLELDLQNPQNTKITVGKTKLTLTDINSQKESETTQRIESTVNDLKDKVSSVEDKVNRIDGIDGVFFYVKYSQYEDGHIMTSVPDKNTEYMGTCSTSDTTAPTDYTKYTWVKVKGTEGTPGKPGDNGKTQYLHIKYSDDGKTFTGNLVPVEFSGWASGLYTDSVIDSDAWIYTVDKIPVTPSTTYVLPSKWKLDELFYLTQYETADDSSFVDLTAGIDDDEDGLSYITTDENANFIRINYCLSLNDVSIGFDDYRQMFESGEIVPSMYLDDNSQGEELGAWIGTLVDFTEADSTNFDDYTWKKFTEDVDEELDSIKQTIHEQYTQLINDSQQIIFRALESYVETDGYEEFRQTVESQLRLLSTELTLRFSETVTQIENINGDLQSKYNNITKYFTFNINGMTIGAINNPNKVVVDNDEISILVNGVVVQRFDADGKALIPELNVTRSFDLFGYIIEQDASGNVNCEYVG